VTDGARRPPQADVRCAAQSLLSRSRCASPNHCCKHREAPRATGNRWRQAIGCAPINGSASRSPRRSIIIVHSSRFPVWLRCTHLVRQAVGGDKDVRRWVRVHQQSADVHMTMSWKRTGAQQHCKDAPGATGSRWRQRRPPSGARPAAAAHHAATRRPRQTAPPQQSRGPAEAAPPARAGWRLRVGSWRSCRGGCLPRCRENVYECRSLRLNENTAEAGRY